MSDKSKDELEREKLALEIKALNRAEWRKAAFWLAVLPTLLAVGTLLVAFKTGLFNAYEKKLQADNTLIKVEAVKLEINIKDLEKQRDQVKAQQAAAEASVKQAKAELADVNKLLDDAQQQLREREIEILKARKVIACVPMRAFARTIHARGQVLASMPTQVGNIGRIATLAEHQLRWTGPRLDDIKYAAMVWQDIVWPPRQGKISPFEIQAMAHVLAKSASIQLGHFAGSDDGFKPWTFTGKAVIDEAMEAVKDQPEGPDRIKALLAAVPARYQPPLDENLAFVVAPSLVKHLNPLTEGVSATVPDDFVKRLGEEMIRHLAAHRKLADYHKYLAAAVEQECRA